MKIFLTGSTGFVGRSLQKELLEAGHELVCLIRPQTVEKISASPQVTVITGDITQPKSLQGTMDGCDAVIHLVGIIREQAKQKITFNTIHTQGSQHLIDEAQSVQIPHFLYMSALGVKKDAPARYLTSKYKAEEYLKKSGLNYTIFRPSFIYGKEDASINMFADLIKKSPFMPIIGDGKYKQQPVALQNVFDGIIQSLGNQQSYKKTYEIGGPEQFEFQEMIDIIASVLGKKTIKIFQPLVMMRTVVKIMGQFSFFPITTDQLKMLIVDNICDEKPYFSTFSLHPIPFKQGIESYLNKVNKQ